MKKLITMVALAVGLHAEGQGTYTWPVADTSRAIAVKPMWFWREDTWTGKLDSVRFCGYDPPYFMFTGENGSRAYRRPSAGMQVYPGGMEAWCGAGCRDTIHFVGFINWPVQWPGRDTSVATLARYPEQWTDGTFNLPRNMWRNAALEGYRTVDNDYATGILPVDGSPMDFFTQREVPDANSATLRFYYYTSQPKALVAEHRRKRTAQKAEAAHREAVAMAPFIKKWGAKYGPAVYHRDIQIGMTKAMIDEITSGALRVIQTVPQRDGGVRYYIQTWGAYSTLRFNAAGRLFGP